MVRAGDIRLVQQTKLCLRVRGLVEAGDAVYVVFRHPADCGLVEIHYPFSPHIPVASGTE